MGRSFGIAGLSNAVDDARQDLHMREGADSIVPTEGDAHALPRHHLRSEQSIDDVLQGTSHSDRSGRLTCGSVRRSGGGTRTSWQLQCCAIVPVQHQEETALHCAVCSRCHEHRRRLLFLNRNGKRDLRPNYGPSAAITQVPQAPHDEVKKLQVFQRTSRLSRRLAGSHFTATR